MSRRTKAGGKNLPREDPKRWGRVVIIDGQSVETRARVARSGAALGGHDGRIKAERPLVGDSVRKQERDFAFFVTPDQVLGDETGNCAFQIQASSPDRKSVV